MKHVPLDSLPEGFHTPYADYVEYMLADGWTLNHSPWYMDDAGKLFPDENDRSVALTRDDFVVWFVDRTHPTTQWRGQWTEHFVAAWASSGQHKIDLPAEYSWQNFLDAKGYCEYCDRVVGTDNLRSISFAGRICAECDTTKPEIRKEAEPAGWYN